MEDKEREEDWTLWEKVLPQIKSIVSIGTTGSGKTAHCFKVLDTAKKVMPNREIYVFKHPKPKLVTERGFKNLYSLEQMDKMSNAVVYIDEPQTVWKIYEKEGNETLATLLTLARQRDILLIISTAMSQFVTRMLEGQVDCWVVKDVDYDSVKQGSRAKKIIQQNSLIDASYFKLEPSEYLFYCRKFPEYCGKHEFVKPTYFDDKLSKPYSIETAAKTAVKSAVKTT